MPLTPNNREEHWLQGMVDGQTTLEPNKRREYWYKEIVDAIGSGGGGGGGGALIATLNMQTGALDKTWNEVNNSTPAFIVVNGSGMKVVGFVTYMGVGIDEKYYIGAISYAESELGIGMLRFAADSADGYPVMQA